MSTILKQSLKEYIKRKEEWNKKIEDSFHTQHEYYSEWTDNKWKYEYEQLDHIIFELKQLLKESY